MAIIDLPAGAKFRNATWQLMSPTQMNRSEWTGAAQVVGLPGAARWSVTAELVPIIGERNQLAMRAFWARLRGNINRVRMPAGEIDQHNPAYAATVAGAGQAGTSLTVTVANLVPGDVFLRAGQMATIADQLVVLTQDTPPASGGSGTTLTFEPPLRGSPSNGQTVVTLRPTCLMVLSQPAVGWQVDPGQVYSQSITAEEWF